MKVQCIFRRSLGVQIPIFPKTWKFIPFPTIFVKQNLQRSYLQVWALQISLTIVTCGQPAPYFCYGRWSSCSCYMCCFPDKNLQRFWKYCKIIILKQSSNSFQIFLLYVVICCIYTLLYVVQYTMLYVVQYTMFFDLRR